jgi:transcriptional regulator with XRE-family HTH domain
MSQRALAEAADIDKSYISKLENGKRSVTSRQLALALARALNLSPREIDHWLVSAGYVSPRMQATVARNGVSRLWEEFDAPTTEIDIGID